MKVLILGTSNCLLKGGAREAIEQYFSKENVTNISLGGTSGTFLALFRFIEGINFSEFDYVFFDFIVNEQWQLRAGRSPSHLMKIARIFYSLLPPGVRYCHLGFSIRSNFFHPNIVEHIHRSLCLEFGITFISIRQILIEFGAKYNIGVEKLFVENDVGHFNTGLVNAIVSQIANVIHTFPPKDWSSAITRDIFFIQDFKKETTERVSYSTSLRNQEYGLFKNNTKIKLSSGSFLGFDYAEIGTEAFIYVNANPFLVKSLHFKVDKPWMKITAFHKEILTNSESDLTISAVPPANMSAEFTDAISSSIDDLSGDAKLASAYFLKIPINETLKAFDLNFLRNFEECYYFESLIFDKISSDFNSIKDLAWGKSV
ncbi:hypothetical protein ACELLULO517_28270 [Acidisoma cellulosilytica]|uniref:Uncharacterized protein n=1 Tax=Acidisoma cellulosilyticum TaxID=2802395 RepID=A0A963Z7Q2_9PROT|nr:hypothetical protein [Acidisoma cellulosilyticum]MCB8884136.1 hypothetical protein [Acidisoma cellulosilyticum]